MGKKKLKKTGSVSSIGSLTSLASIQITVPEREGADFIADNDYSDRGTWVVSPFDKARFKELSQNVQPRSVVPESVRNKRYNRHLDVLPNPLTRVQLPMIDGEEASTYVNANYVRGASGNPREYICAMGPLPATLKNWWRMIWQEKVTCIAMVTGLTEKNVKKCERYWAPKPGQKVKVLDMFVRTIGVKQGKGYLRTLLEIHNQTTDEKRKVMHLWYNSWPDHGVPRTDDGKPDPTNLLYMIRDARISENELGKGGPILTHCSAGVGRSGTWIALDIACQVLESNKRADLLKIVKDIREDRVALVQHPQQYELAYAGVALYAKFVQATLKTSPKVIDATSVKKPREKKQEPEPVDQDNVYGAPVEMDPSSSSEYGTLMPKTDYSVMKGVPDSENPYTNAKQVLPPPQSMQGLYGNDSVVQQHEVRRQSMQKGELYGNQDAVDDQRRIAAEKTVIQSEYSAMPRVDANQGEMYSNIDEPLNQETAIGKRILEQKSKENEALAEERRRAQALEQQQQELASMRASERKEKIAQLQSQLKMKGASLDEISRERDSVQRELDAMDAKVVAAEAKVRTAQSAENDASIALKQAQTKYESKQEQLKEVTGRLGKAQQLQLAEQERLRKEALRERISAILGSIGLSTMGESGLNQHAQSIAVSMMPSVGPSKGSKRKVIPDRDAAARSKREAVEAIDLLAAMGAVSRYA